jgi:hypothetical protein
LQDTLRQQVEELSRQVEQLQVIAQDTERNIVHVYDKVDELTGVMAAQEESFNKRLSDMLAQLQEKAEGSSMVADLCAKVTSQETQLMQLMEEREVAVETSSAVTGATRGYFTRAAKAVGLS